MGAAVRHCSMSSVFSEVFPRPATLLTEQWHTENPASAMNLSHTQTVCRHSRRQTEGLTVTGARVHSLV